MSTLASQPLSNVEDKTGRAAGRTALVDVNEAARFLAVSVSTVYGWVWQRRISFVKVGRALRFDIADLKGFVEQNRVHARSHTKF